MSRPSPRSSLHLEPPRKSVELVDSGAHELQSSEGEDEYFSDASEGRRRSSRPATPASPIPKTRIEKVDDTPRHGEVPGTPAYVQRTQDAVPDEVEVVPEGQHIRRSSQQIELQKPPENTKIPRTVVEKIDPSSPSHGDIPGTTAYTQRQADAAPDIILTTSKSKDSAPHGTENRERSVSDVPIPETVVTRVDSLPAHGEVEGTAAYEKRRMDASPDVLERKNGAAGSPTFDRSLSATDRTSTTDSDGSTNEGNQRKNGGDFADDFDDFEESQNTGVVADDDFGDFDDGLQEPVAETAPAGAANPSESVNMPTASFSLIDFEALSSIPDLLAATETHLDAMFPSTASDKLASVSIPEAIDESSPIFPSDRSRSLWKQLITPPPLQPPIWTQSRIRRLFLVSLGVPVDLDEILPPSKQKKLILPDINLEASLRKSDSDKPIGSVARLKAQAGNDSTGSVDSAQSAGGANTKSSRSRRPKGPPPPPELDLIAVKRLCATTDEKIDGFTDAELKAHVKSLENTTEKTSELLEYWLKRRDGVRKEKEAFEGVIENLVRHARRVRN